MTKVTTLSKRKIKLLTMTSEVVIVPIKFALLYSSRDGRKQALKKAKTRVMSMSFSSDKYNKYWHVKRLGEDIR